MNEAPLNSFTSAHTLLQHVVLSLPSFLDRELLLLASRPIVLLREAVVLQIQSLLLSLHPLHQPRSQQASQNELCRVPDEDGESVQRQLGGED